MGILSVSVALVAVVIVLFFYSTTKTFSYWKNKGITYVKPYPLVGSLWSVISLKEHMGEFFNRMYEKYKGNKFVGYFQGATPGLIVMDTDLIKNIVIKDFSHFLDHGFEIDESLDPLQAKNLFQMKGEKWRQMRNKLSPTFTSGKMKAMFPLVDVCAKNVEKHVLQQDGKDVDIRDLLARYTTDVIGSCAFGINVDSVNDPLDQFRVMGRRMMEVDLIQGIKNAFIVFVPEIASLLRFKFFTEEIYNFFRGLVKEIVGQRTKSGNNRKDFMQLLIQLKEKGKIDLDNADAHEIENPDHPVDHSYKLEDDDITAQALVFFFAGFETSSSTLTLAMMEMARSPLVQQKARENIEEVLERHDGVMSYQALQEMTYLDWILQESLRMYPPAVMLHRTCTTNYTIPGTNVSVEKGTIVMIPIMALQNDPQYYDDPNVFNPDRFKDEERNRKNQFVYMPFGEGPRQCIGTRFAKMQSKLGLYAILRNFEVLESSETVYPPQWDPRQFMLTAKYKIYVQLKPLKK